MLAHDFVSTWFIPGNQDGIVFGMALARQSPNAVPLVTKKRIKGGKPSGGSLFNTTHLTNRLGKKKARSSITMGKSKIMGVTPPRPRSSSPSSMSNEQHNRENGSDSSGTIMAKKENGKVIRKTRSTRKDSSLKPSPSIGKGEKKKRRRKDEDEESTVEERPDIDEIMWKLEKWR